MAESLSGVVPHTPDDVRGLFLFDPEPLRPEGLWLPKPKKILHVANLPRYNQVDRDRIPWLEAVHWKF